MKATGSGDHQSSATMHFRRPGLTVVAGALLAVQCVNGAYTVLVNSLVLGGGVSPLFYIAVTNVASAAICLPLAVSFERTRWPAKITPAMWIQLALIGIAGSVVFQEVLMAGMAATTPAITMAMLNLSPAIIFLISACIKLENVNISRNDSVAKILGTAVCLIGAIAMSVLQNDDDGGASTSSSSSGGLYVWIQGCLLLLIATLLNASSVVLQATVMRSLPAPFTVCVVTWMMGALSCPLLQLVIDCGVTIGRSDTLIDAKILEITAVGGIFGPICFTTVLWCIAVMGPVFASMFSPVATVCSSVVSAVVFGQLISVESMVGMVLIFLGLCVFLWGKSKEDAARGALETETPLLS